MRRRGIWEVWRPEPVDDGRGGQFLSGNYAKITTERGDVRELTGRELLEARQAGAEHTHTGWFRLRADIRRGDELRQEDVRVEVLTSGPTFPPTRLRLVGRSVEAGE